MGIRNGKLISEQSNLILEFMGLCLLSCVLQIRIFGFHKKTQICFSGFRVSYLLPLRMPAEICIYLCRCISVLCPENGKFDLGTICSQKVRESVPMYNCHSESQNLRKEPPRNLQFFHENNTINSFEFLEIPKSGDSFFFHFD